MFHLSRPTPGHVLREIEIASQLEFTPAEFLAPRAGLKVGTLPAGLSHNQSRTTLGSGETVFARAERAFARWQNFDLGWVRVANPTAPLEVGQIVAVEVRSLGLWSLNLSRIVEVIRDPLTFGFIYRTTIHHIEDGEERFLLSMDPDSGTVEYTLEAVSRPRALLARIGFPIARAFQHKFARDSHRRMHDITMTLA